ncbi:Isochorismatase hydrolase [Cylindrobasidium torrendii FP15055 ss-10]|uniref:nicotinamidase n=1 Tax=Cylindrobasidium torrendii FP15055 ss-10 TaxID=1314674 RepID=A0A0D7BNG3_9AGAR|nr:Isochorismatase hydrolase [Cylindrobasidium torrendii FP15055 ss-10]
MVNLTLAICAFALQWILSGVAALPYTSGIPYRTKKGHAHPNTALLIVDVQYDFINGTLGNERAYSILPTIYDLLDNHTWSLIATSQDWHPEGHVSFASAHEGKKPGDVIQTPLLASRYNETAMQALYNDHCVPGTVGAQIEEGVQTRIDTLMGTTPITQIHKAQNHLVDSYSAFADNQYYEFTVLGPEMRAHGITDIVVVGLITNACVYGSTVDGIKMGWDVTVISDGVETTSQAEQDEALEELRTWWGANIVSLSEFEST